MEPFYIDGTQEIVDNLARLCEVYSLQESLPKSLKDSFEVKMMLILTSAAVRQAELWAAQGE